MSDQRIHGARSGGKIARWDIVRSNWPAANRRGLAGPDGKSDNPLRYLNSSPEEIRLAVMMYVEYPLSPCNVQDQLAACPLRRGLDRHCEADGQCRPQSSGPCLHGLLGGALNLGGAAARLPFTVLLTGNGRRPVIYAT